MKRKLLFLSVLLLFGVCLVSAQQNLSVSGVVSDANDGNPLVGVSVIVKGTTLGTVTDLDGRYTIKVSQGATLVFSYIGMEKQEISVKSSVLNVKLQSDAQMLGEVVAVGYGTMKKKLLKTHEMIYDSLIKKDIETLNAAIDEHYDIIEELLG